MKATLLLGSNLGDSLNILEQSRILIRKNVGSIIVQSSVLHNKAWGYESSNDYFNQIVIVDTIHAPLALLDTIEDIERLLGRIKEPCDWRSPRLYEDRTIDIDILLYDDIEYEDARLKIPHPKMVEREFVKTLMLEFKYEVDITK